MTCAECKFWVAVDTKPTVGECHRRAPKPSVGSPMGSTRGVTWPITLDVTFCGEFIAKAEKRASFV